MEGHSPERNLFCAVLLVQVLDACAKPRPRHIYKVRDTVRIVPEGPSTDTVTARNYLLSNSRNFRTVCEWSGLDPQAVRDRILKMQQRGWPVIKEKIHDITVHTRYLSKLVA